ncbi:MAG TPA: SDR family oxidoreductase [Noviherbaspirillum sp.]|nr:SDR family oxidoreductase [Noviherbaspirillum sp.]
MDVRLKKLSEQTIVLTGATSGIGLVTAREAARRGAKLVLVARNEDALKQLQKELQAKGCEAICVAADVANDQEMRRVSQAAIDRFGGFDTWVNNAGVSIFGRLEDVPLEDQRRLFETNFWGVVHGSMVAVEHLKQRGGALINIGSEVSLRAVPLQGMYSASKHAVKGFTDSLRSELEEVKAPVSVTLVKPAAIDTMFLEHAKNVMDVEAQLPPPVYAPEAVAEAILHAAEHPRRDIYVGGASKLVATASAAMPRMVDRIMSLIYRQQRSNRPVNPAHRDSLHAPGPDMKERGGQERHVFETSAYTKASLRPRLATTLALGAGLAGVAAATLLRKRHRTA